MLAFGVHMVPPYLLVLLFSLPLPEVLRRPFELLSMPPAPSHPLALGLGLRGHLLLQLTNGTQRSGAICLQSTLPYL